MFKYILFYLIINCILFAINCEIVKTKVGSVRGTVLKTRYNEEFYGFFGIPYAEAPVGNNRFKPAIPKNSLGNDIYDATKENYICYQFIEPAYNSLLSPDKMSEDCLRINIFTKSLNPNNKKPVLVNIHGGGFESGSSSFNSSQPIYIMERDIVYVTINYRVGILGFLSTGTEDSPGNNGLKDQVLALKWIQENIGNFGGDPNSVTLIGHTAGAVSVTLHMVSPMSRGLFHRAIPMSGSAAIQFNFTGPRLNIAERLAAEINCPREQYTIKEMVDCLRKASPELIVKHQFAAKKDPILQSWYFIPVIEPDFGQERFIIEDPLKSLQAGRFQNVPVLTGFAQNEFAFFGFVIAKNDKAMDQFRNHFDDVAPICFQYETNTEKSHNMSEIIKKNFLQELTPMNLGTVYGDATISFGVHRFVQLIWKKTNVYYYKTSYVGRFSRFNNILSNASEICDHEDDIKYLLYIPSIGPIYNITDVENIKIEQLTRLWTNFAKFGSPNDPDDSFIGGVNWTPFDADHKYLDIGNQLIMKENLFTERFKIWEEIFPLTYQSLNDAHNHSEKISKNSIMTIIFAICGIFFKLLIF